MTTIEQYWFGFVVESNGVAVSKSYNTKTEAESFQKEFDSQKWLSHDQLDRLDKQRNK